MYYVLIICILYGIWLGIEQMSINRQQNITYEEPKNLIDFLINGK